MKTLNNKEIKLVSAGNILTTMAETAANSLSTWQWAGIGLGAALFTCISCSLTIMPVVAYWLFRRDVNQDGSANDA